MFAWRALPARADATAGAFLTVPELAGAGIRVAFTARRGGLSAAPYASLNLSYVSGDDPAVVRANRARALDALGSDAASWTSARQVHGCRVTRVTASDRGAGCDSPTTTIPETDALWTDEPEIALAVLTADCVPLLLTDGSRIAAVHAGWRGLVGGVIGEAVRALGSRGLLAYVGPSIGPCCYVVGADVATIAEDALGASVVRRVNGTMRLDLWRGVREALSRSGVHTVHLASLCTRCEPHRFFSHRAGDAGRQGMIAMIAA